MILKNPDPMQRILLLACALAACLTGRPEARAFFPETSHNFGAFAEDDGPVTCRFPIVNTGDEPLVVVGARATCGCTQPKYPLDPIEPGDTAYIDVTYDPIYRPGRFEKAVTVETNTNPQRNKLTIRGTVIGGERSIGSRYPIDFGPLKSEHGAAMLGDVTANSFTSHHMRLYNQSADSVYAECSPSVDYLEADLAPNPVPPGEQASLIIVYNGLSGDRYGFQEDSITITVAGDCHIIPVTTNIAEDFSKLSESELAKAPVALYESTTCDLGIIRSRRVEKHTTAKITNAGKSNLIVRRVYTLDPGVSYEIDSTDIKPGESAIISITVDPSQQHGEMINAKLNVITNDPANPVQTLRLVGEYPKVERVGRRR